MITKGFTLLSILDWTLLISKNSFCSFSYA